MRQARVSETNRRLGYPDDARLLIVNADDLGMYPAINDGVAEAFRAGIVRSTSLMMPCPAAPAAIDLLRANPELTFAVHLSLIRDIPAYTWGPMAPKSRVPSLLDTDGELYTLARQAALLANARVDEVTLECRSQIEAVLATGLRPTHLDWHCLHCGGREDICQATVDLAQEYGLAVRAGMQPYLDQIRRLGYPTTDFDVLDSFSLDLPGKADRYAELLRSLPIGLSEWAVHPSTGDAAARALDPDGWRVRRSDLEFLVLPQARQIIADEGITLLNYQPVQRAWQAQAASHQS